MRRCAWGWRKSWPGCFDPGHLALTLMAEKLIALRQQTHPRTLQSPGLTQQYADLVSHFTQRAAWKEKALTPARANGAGG